MESKKFNYKLRDVLKYSSKGEFHTTGEIVFGGPTPSVLSYSVKLAQFAMGALMDGQARLQGKPEAKKDDGKPEVEMTGDAFKVILFASKQDLEQMLDAFYNMAYRVCEVGDGVLLNENLKDELDADDIIDMMCGYVAFFTMPSLLSGEEA